MRFSSEPLLFLRSLEAFIRVARRGGFSNESGFPERWAFEKEFADFLDIEPERVVGVGSGTDALIFALKLSNVGANDEVIIPAFGFVSPAAATRWVGATPVFVDVSEKNFAMTPADVERAITSNTKAVITAHAFGHTGDIAALRAVADKHGIVLIEDAAQLIGEMEDGSMAGTGGHFGCFSFSALKTLSSLGYAGALVTNDVEQAKRARWMSNYGARRHFDDYPVVGTNAPMQEIQAAILRESLSHLPDWLENARNIAAYYRKRFTESDTLSRYFTLFPEVPQAYYQFPVRVNERDALLSYMRKNASQVASELGYAIPLVPLQTQYQQFTSSGQRFPEASTVSKEVLTLPLQRSMSENDAGNICDALEACVTEFQ